MPPLEELRARLPASLAIEASGELLQVRLARPEKRNALDDTLVAGLRTLFEAIPATVRAVVLSGSGDHFSAGLDLSELEERDAVAGIAHSRLWHKALDAIQFGPVPVIAHLHGAVVGGGLELACAAHIRVAETSVFYALPEGQRGIFVGGGASVRLPRLIGVARMMDMMMTGRVLRAEEGATIGISQYLVPAGEGAAKALELAHRVAANAPMTNYALMHVLPRIADMSHDQGLVTEALVSAIAQSAPEAKARLRDFLDGRAKKVGER